MMEILQVFILGLCLGFVYALMVSGLTLIFGVMRIVNLAHPILIISGAFVSYWLFIKFGMDPILSVPAAALTVALLGVLLYKLIFEKNAAQQTYSEMTVLLTFGTAMVIDGLLAFLFHNTQRITSPGYATDAIFIGEIFIPLAQFRGCAVFPVANDASQVLARTTDAKPASRAASAGLKRQARL